MILVFMVPPSALPGISPSRGEIGKTLSSCLVDAVLHAANSTGRWTFRPCRRSISLLEGEMVGRPEGGVTASDRGALQ